jgi:signal transduction histidine kinase
VNFAGSITVNETSDASIGRSAAATLPAVLTRLRAQLRRPWPLRLRVTFAVTGATALVLAAAGVLVYVQFGRALDARTDAELHDRVEALSTLASRVPAQELLADSGEPFAQVYDAAGGRLLNSTARLEEDQLLTREQVARAAQGPIRLRVEGLSRLSRGADVRAAPVSGDRVVAVAENRSRREDELRRLAALLAIVLPGTLALSAFIGYQVAGAALRPVDRIRREAQGITEGDYSARLREPGTRDELDRLTGTLNDLLARLATAVERERRIVSDAAHELRTPMTVLRTRLDVAARGEPDAETLQEAIRDAQVDVARLARLADDLLVLARADQGRLPLRPEPLDVQDVVEAAVARNEPSAVELGRELSGGVRIPGGAVVLADPVRLAQALDNVVANALIHGDGRVTLRARLDPQGGRRVAFVVADQGEGFGEELLPHAFERFVQDPHRPHGTGAGLGLALVAALVEAQGGAVRATNIASGGAEVTLLLPRA